MSINTKKLLSALRERIDELRTAHPVGQKILANDAAATELERIYKKAQAGDFDETN